MVSPTSASLESVQQTGKQGDQTGIQLDPPGGESEGEKRKLGRIPIRLFRSKEGQIHLSTDLTC